MTMTSTHLASLTHHANGAQLPVVARVALFFAATVTVWDQRYRTRRALGRLNERELNDIGLTIADARLEARKKMWHF